VSRKQDPPQPHRRWGRVAPAAAIALGAAIFAAPAPAAVTAPTGAQALTTFPDSNIAIAEGLRAGDRLDVLVRRGGTVIGQALNRVVPPGGALEVNHGPDSCWEDVTPDIAAGDEIEFVATGTADGIGMRVGDVTVQAPQSAGGDTVTVQGTSTEPVATLVARIRDIGAGRNRLEASSDGTLDGDLEYTGGTTWTATYTGVDNVDEVLAGAAEGHVVAGNAVTIAEVGGVQACPEPIAANAMTGLSRTTVNIADQGTPITVSGVAQPGITVALSAGGRAVPVQDGGGTWTATITAGDLAALPQGASAVTATFSGAGAPGPQTRTITKDTIAPDAPAATPGPGTYTTTQFVTLSSPGATVRWTNGPGAPSTAFTQPIAVSSSQTLRAIAVDPAGNESRALVAFAYVIQGAPAVGGTTTGGGGVLTPVTVGASTTKLALKSLSVNSRMRRSTVRRQGVRLVMRLADGTGALRIRVYRRKRSGTKTLLATGTRAPRAAGLYRTVLKDPRLRRNLTPGSYEVEVTPGRSLADLGTPARYAFKVTGR
jgi:hypothetical protein